MLSKRSSIALARLASGHAQDIRRTAGRTFASATSVPTSSTYEASDVLGIKTAVRDNQGPTTKLAIVAKAGSRFQPSPGLSAGLEAFAFKNTQKRSALRIVRESELLGSQLTAYHTREALVVEASFFRNDLPYFVELLAEVAADTKYTTHEFHEEVESVIRLKQQKFSANPAALALDAAHSVAYHGGLGKPLYPTVSTPTKSYLNEQAVADFAASAYTKGNIALVADGVSQANISRWTEQFFKSVPSSAASSAAPLDVAASKYYGGEHRSPLASGNALVIAFSAPGKGPASPEAAVLAALVGAGPSIKWSPGFTVLSRAIASTQGLSAQASALSYSDAGLLAIQLAGPAAAVRHAAEETAKALRGIAEGSISKEVLAKGIAKAKFDLLEASQSREHGILLAGSSLVNGGTPVDFAGQTKQIDSVTAEKLAAAAKAMLGQKASVAAIGDLHVLPYAEELGLSV